MSHAGTGMNRRSPLRSGLTLLESLFLLITLAVVAWFLIPRRPARKVLTPRLHCAAKLRALHRGVEMYRDASGDFIPYAWHVAGPAVVDDLSNLSFFRFTLLEYCDPAFRRVVTPADVQRNGGNLLVARQEKYRLAAAFWKCPVRGWTDDYFASGIVFRSDGRPARGAELLQQGAAAQRPLLADVNASLPDPEARDIKDPGHNQELRDGFGLVAESDMEVFVGAGPSLRVEGHLPSTRFDYRHEGTVNVLFFDGHVDALKPDDPRLEQIHRNWNHLEASQK